MIEIKEWDDIEGCWETSRYFNVHEFKNGEAVCEVWNGYQVKELEYLFPIIKTCENCGSEFRPSSRSKTCLCGKCLQKQNNRKAMYRMRLLRDLRCSGHFPSPL